MLLFCSVFLCSTEDALAAGYQVPILMYHHISNHSYEINSMTITEQRFREDMEFLQQQGYTPLNSLDLIQIRSGAKAMPQKPIMITFDDGYESNYTYAYPILKETGMKATISLITSQILDAPSDASQFMTWAQAKEMYQSGIVDIGCHTHRLHNQDNLGLLKKSENGIQRKKKETWASYQQRVGSDINTALSLIRSHIPGITVYYFSYPFGATDSWFGQQITDHNLQVTTTTVRSIASIRNGLYGLPRIRVTMDQSVSQMFSKTTATKAETVNLTVNGQRNYQVTAYKIDGSYCLKLRDMAKLLKDTPTQFNVTWNAAAKQTEIITGQYYIEQGNELSLTTPNQSASAVPQTKSVLLNGKYHMIPAYTINGNTYVKLRAFAKQIGCGTGWDPANHIIILQTR